MEKENSTPEVSKKRSSAQDFLEYIPDWVPGIGAMKESRKRIEGKSTKPKKKDNPFGVYE